MHELSLAEEVMALVARHAGGMRVRRITLTVGALAGVEPEALRFALGSVTRGTLADGADIVLVDEAAVARCPACGSEQGIEARYDPCSACGAFGLTLLAGDALRVASIEGEPEDSEHV